MSGVRVSVLLPVRNGEATISRAVDSILDDLTADDELVIVDDGSTDSTLDKLADLHRDFRVVRGRGSGIVDALNLGLRTARGRFVARCDADDAWLPGHTEELLSTMLMNPQARTVFGAARMVGEDGGPRGTLVPPLNEVDLRRAILRGNPFVHGTVLADRDAMVGLGGYRQVPGAEDYDLWLRMYRRGWIATTTSEVYQYQLSAADGHRAKRLVQARSTLRILAEHAAIAHEASARGLVRNGLSALWGGPRFWYGR